MRQDRIAGQRGGKVFQLLLLQRLDGWQDENEIVDARPDRLARTLAGISAGQAIRAGIHLQLADGDGSQGEARR